MNKVILMGRLTREPDIRFTSAGPDGSQKMIARYTLAVDRKGRDINGEQKADFISCVAFDRAAEFVEKFLHQGTKIIVIGHIQTGAYTNREGQRVYTTDIIVEEHYFPESKSAASAQTAQRAPEQQTESGFMSIPEGMESDLPFA